MLGFAVPRDKNRCWKARAKQPIAGIGHVYAAFTGASIDAVRADPDPAIDDLGLDAPDLDCVDLATALLGPAHRIDHYHHWQRGEGELSIGEHYLSWVRHGPRGLRDADEEALLIADLATLIERDITWDAIEQIFGPTHVEGRTDSRVVRRPTWYIGVPLAQQNPYNVTVSLEPPLPCEPLFAAFGWHDLLIDHDQQRVVTALDASSRWYPLAENGFLVNVSIHAPEGLTLGVPYASAARQRILQTHHLYMTRSLMRSGRDS
jgi:hypothetical protein